MPQFGVVNGRTQDGDNHTTRAGQPASMATSGRKTMLSAVGPAPTAEVRHRSGPHHRLSCVTGRARGDRLSRVTGWGVID